MEPMYYIGPGVRKRKISYCIKDSSGMVYAEGSLPATRIDLDCWMKTLPQPWSAAMEATMFPRSSRAVRRSFRPLDKDLSWKSAHLTCGG